MPAGLYYLLSVSITTLLAVLGATWRLSAQLSKNTTIIDQMLTNHLPHIEARLSHLEEQFIELLTKKTGETTN